MQHALAGWLASRSPLLRAFLFTGESAHHVLPLPFHPLLFRPTVPPPLAVSSHTPLSLRIPAYVSLFFLCATFLLAALRCTVPRTVPRNVRRTVPRAVPHLT